MVLDAAGQVEECIVLVNKSDLPQQADLSNLTQAPLVISAKEGSGLDALETEIAQRFPSGTEQQGELLTNARQAEAAQRAEQALEAVRDGLKSGMSPDAVLSDVEFAMTALAEVTGRRRCDRPHLLPFLCGEVTLSPFCSNFFILLFPFWS